MESVADPPLREVAALMPFIPNPVGLAALLLEPQSPIGVKTVEATEMVEEQARKNAEVIIRTISMDSVVGHKVDFTGTGPRGTVGVFGSGSVSDYLDQKAVNEKGSGTPGDWLTTALDVLIPLGWKVKR